MIFITAPHVCIVDERKDPSCDAHTDKYAQVIASSVNGKVV